MAVIDFRAKQLAEIRLHPIDLGFKRARSQRGRPLLAHGEVAREVLDLLPPALAALRHGRGDRGGGRRDPGPSLLDIMRPPLVLDHDTPAGDPPCPS